MSNIQAKKHKRSISQGDIFRLGNHLLLCGSSMDKNLVSNLVQQEEIKLILTDPPYGVAYVESALPSHQMSHEKIANDHLQTEIEYKRFSESWLESVKPYFADKNAYYIFNSDKMLFSLKDALTSQNFKFSQLLIWVKTGAVIGRLDYHPQHELILYGWHGKHPAIRDKDKSVLVAPKPRKNTVHPTMKPISLLRRLILNSTNLGDIVYDPFGGSGSTLIACEQTKRRCLMVELEEKYCQVIIERFEKLTGQEATLLTTSNHD
jgi:DNA modification methylase